MTSQELQQVFVDYFNGTGMRICRPLQMHVSRLQQKALEKLKNFLQEK